MVRRLLGGLATVREDALAARRQFCPGALVVAVPDRLLRDKIVSNSTQRREGPVPFRDTGPDLLLHGRADRI
jgi:hypothetical protein